MGPVFLHDFFYEFVTLFVILDPFATVPLFLLVTSGLNRRQSLLVAAYALGIAFLILLFFIVLGRPLLSALHIPMASFQLAGSLILLLFGLKMALGKVAEEAMTMPADATPLQRAIFPLAVPGIAGAAILALCLRLPFVGYAIAVGQRCASGPRAVEPPCESNGGQPASTHCALPVAYWSA